MYLWGLLEDFSTWFSRPCKVIHSHQWASFNLLRAQIGKKEKMNEGQISSLFLSLNIHLSLPLDIGATGSTVPGLWDLHQQPPGSQAFGLGLNYITSFPSFPACRGQLHNTVSIINPSSSLCELDIHYWFCFSEEPWLI